MSGTPLPADSVVDLAIIGGGPTGLFAAFYAGLRRMSVKIIDSLEILGGQLTTLYPEKHIYDVAGFPRVIAKDLAARLIEQGLQFGATTCLGEQVQTLERPDGADAYILKTDRGLHRARAILIAAGVGAFEPRRLALPDAAPYEGRGLYYSLRDPGELRGRRVLLVGGGDSAVDWANALEGIAASRTLIHRRDILRAHEASVEQMLAGSTHFLPFHELRLITGEGRVQQAVVYDNRTQETQTFAVDAVLVNIGFVNSLGPIKHWGLELQGGSIRVDSTMQTNRPGIFAAGDVASYPGKLKLIATGFGEAATAVNHAKRYLDPTANVFPGHSTNMKLESAPKHD
jgi:thioredoxin reductase (NADPH)